MGFDFTFFFLVLGLEMTPRVSFGSLVNVAVIFSVVIPAVQAQAPISDVKYVVEGAWCVCKPEVPSTSLQKTLDYACGAGADCNPIHQNGPCYNPDTVLAHCSYATNSYYQRNGQNMQACDFSGTAQLILTDPSQAGCTYPATPSAAGTNGSTSNNSPTTLDSSSTTPGGTFIPNSPTTSTGTNGDNGMRLGPSGIGLDDDNHAASLLKDAKMGFLFTTYFLVPVLALLKN